MLETLLKSRKAGQPTGVYSCCSANEDVLVAAMLRAMATQSPLLVEATSNQVNQFGGYTGKTPAEFAQFVRELARKTGLPASQLVLGGDHLGPLVWVDKPEEEAMVLAEQLVRAYVAAGYEKIHLDTSMRLASDDPEAPFPVDVCARRGARLCAACEDEFAKRKANEPAVKPPIYVIGSEVPVPGGEVGNDPSSAVTTPNDYDVTVQAYEGAFHKLGLDDAFGRVCAIVVEMGVEFSEYQVSRFDHETFLPLASHVVECGRGISLEAHSTDFQTRESLALMREDGAVFLKVGPAFTFAARSALFKLELIERELVPCEKWSHYREALDAAMLANPSKWRDYYKGSDAEVAFARAFSFSDRCRYYLDVPSVKEAHDKLLSNLEGVKLPQCLLISLFSAQYEKIEHGELKATAKEVLYDSIGDAIDDYLFATNENKVG